MLHKKYIYIFTRHLHSTHQYCRHRSIHTCVAALNPVFRLFMDLKTELTPRLSVSRFLATVLTVTCHSCELQFLVVLGLLADLRDNEYGHSSSNRSRSFRWVADSAQHSVSGLDWQHSPPTKLNLRRIMFEHLLERIPPRVNPIRFAHDARKNTRTWITSGSEHLPDVVIIVRATRTCRLQIHHSVGTGRRRGVADELSQHDRWYGSNDVARNGEEIKTLQQRRTDLLRRQRYGQPPRTVKIQNVRIARVVTTACSGAGWCPDAARTYAQCDRKGRRKYTRGITGSVPRIFFSYFNGRKTLENKIRYLRIAYDYFFLNV